MDYSPEQLLEFWKKGLPLNKALIEFTDAKIQYSPKQYNSDQLTSDNFLAMLENITGASEYDNKLKTDLSNKIKNGNLIAVGYEPPMKSSADSPIIIPLHVWDNPEINKQQTSVVGNGLKFLSVRIIKKSALPKLQNNSPSKIKLPKPNIEDKPVGRPSQKEDLINAFAWMIKNNRIDKSKSLKAHADELNIAVSRVNPNSKYIGNLNYKTINRHLGELFNQYKKSQNQSQN